MILDFEETRPQTLASALTDATILQLAPCSIDLTPVILVL
jgi:hypothetical protein